MMFTYFIKFNRIRMTKLATIQQYTQMHEMYDQLENKDHFFQFFLVFNLHGTLCELFTFLIIICVHNYSMFNYHLKNSVSSQNLIKNFTFLDQPQCRFKQGGKLIQIDQFIIEVASIMSQTSNTQAPTLKRWNLQKELNKGPWTQEEHLHFLIGIERFSSKAWEKIAQLVETRDQVQVRSHAQKYFNRKDNQLKRIENQILPKRLMNTSQKTRSKISLEEQDNKMEIEENNPVSMQIQDQMIEYSKEIKTKRITKSLKLNKKKKIHDKQGQNQLEGELIKATYPNTEVNDAQTKGKIILSNMNKSYEITQKNNLSGKKRTPSKRQNISTNKKCQRQNGIHMLQTAASSIIHSSNKHLQSSTKDNIVLIMCPYPDYFNHQDSIENIHSNTAILGSVFLDFRVSNYSAFKPVVNSLN